jgi:hypothetical protein
MNSGMVYDFRGPRRLALIWLKRGRWLGPSLIHFEEDQRRLPDVCAILI